MNNLIIGLNKNGKTQVRIKNIGKYLIIFIITIIFLSPMYWLIVCSLKTDSEITRLPLTFFPKKIELRNFMWVMEYLHFGQSFFNSFIVSVSATILIVIFASMSGFAFSKLHFFGKNIFYNLLIGTMIIPPAVLLLPLFFIITKVGFYDNLIGLVIPFSVTVFGIIFMKQNISTIPDNIFESAKVDGCSEFQMFVKIVLPVMKPALVSLSIIEFINNWNSFTMPLVLLKSSSKFTIPLRLGMLSQENVAVPWSQIMAANVIVIIPVIVIFLLLQRFFVYNIMEGSIKG